MKKITSANESEIDSLEISASTKAVFHTAIDEGRIIFTPTKPVTYGEWNGLFYTLIDFEGGNGSYVIGEGLNGGYSICGMPGANVICQWPTGWHNFWIHTVTRPSSATIITPTNNQQFMLGDLINWRANYTSIYHSWTENLTLRTTDYGTGTKTLRSGYGTSARVDVGINGVVIGTPGQNGNNNSTYDRDIVDSVNLASLSTSNPDFRKVLRSIAIKESKNDPYKIRYEPCTDQDYSDSIINLHPWAQWRLPGRMPDGSILTKGTQVDSLKSTYGKTPQEMLKAFTDFGMNLTDNDNDGIVEPTDNDGTLSIYEVWKNNDSVQNYTTASKCGSSRISPSLASGPAQLLIASSYGVAQITYRWFAKDFDQSQSPPALDIWQMFSIRPNIILAGKVIKGTWNDSSNIQGMSCDAGDRLWTAIAKYNGGIVNDRSTLYANGVCNIYKGL